MSKKELAYSVIDTLSEEKINAFLTLFADKNTLARIETDILANDENAMRFQSVDELFEELENDLQ